MHATLVCLMQGAALLGALIGGLLGEWLGLRTTLRLAACGELLAIVWISPLPMSAETESLDA